MGAVLMDILAGLLRYVLAGVISWLITNGIATEAQTTQVIAGLASAIALVGWMVWNKYRARVKLLTALTTPKGTTVDELKGLIARGVTAPVSTPNDAVPVAAKTDGSVKPRLGAIVLPFLLAGAVAASACGGLTPAPVIPQPTEAQVQVVRAKAIEIARAVESVGGLVVEARRTTGAAYDAKLITLDQRNAVYQAVIDLEPKAHAVIDIAASVTADVDLRAVVRLFTGVMDDLLAKLSAGDGPMAAVAATIRTGLAVVTTYLGGGL